MRLVKYFQSLNFTILLCILSMITQGYHSFYTFNKTSNIDGFLGIIQSLLFVFVFELFTLYYLVRGKKGMALFYSICYLIMNLFYYGSQPELNYTAIFLSFIIPFSIYNVAENIPKEMALEVKKVEHDNIESIIDSKLQPINDEIDKLKFRDTWDKEAIKPIRVKKGENENN